MSIHTLSQYLRDTYGCRVEKICVNAGFTCPTRDGTKGREGCLFCDSTGAGSVAIPQADTVHDQIALQIQNIQKKRTRPVKYIVYFQAFTNTYAPCASLRSVYAQAFTFPDVVGIAVGTRPDTLSGEVIDLLKSYSSYGMVMVEIGVQSMHQRSLDFLKRGHTVQDSINAVKACKQAGLSVVAHIIVGIPGETDTDMYQTVERLVGLGIDGIKIHLLHVLHGTQLEVLYKQGSIPLLTKERYVAIVAHMLTLLPPSVVVHRMTGEAPREQLCAPLWALDKMDVINAIMKRYKK